MAPLSQDLQGTLTFPRSWSFCVAFCDLLWPQDRQGPRHVQISHRVDDHCSQDRQTTAWTNTKQPKSQDLQGTLDSQKTLVNLLCTQTNLATLDLRGTLRLRL